MIHIDKNTKELANNINKLLITSTSRLEDIKTKLIYEKERLQDITILCNKYTDFENAINLYKNDFDGDFGYNKNSFYCHTANQNNLRYNILSILGNGYEGNKYVYNEFDKEYLEKTLDTSKKDAIKDSSVSTYWEYSRITASDTEKYICPEVNFDSEEAKCTLILQAESTMNEVIINSENDNIIISEVYTSNDNITYHNTGFTPKAINSKEDQYKDHDYIYSSGRIAFAPAKYVKISFESRGHSNDTIAFEKKIVLEDNNKELISTETHIISTANRHIIKLNDIAIKKNIYSSESTMTSRELISDSVSTIALFCNTYLPQGLSNDAIKFILTVDGKDYDIIPVNSHNNGKKIIRFSQGTMKSDYTTYTSEKIKSARLKVIMKSINGITPYINNIKILVGDE